MAKQFERTMLCKNCGQVEIGKAIEDNVWYEVENDTQAHFYKCSKAPHRGQKTFTPRAKTKGLEFDAIAAELKDLKSRVTNIEEAVKGLVLEISYKTGKGEPVNG